MRFLLSVVLFSWMVFCCSISTSALAQDRLPSIVPSSRLLSHAEKGHSASSPLPPVQEVSSPLNWSPSESSEERRSVVLHSPMKAHHKFHPRQEQRQEKITKTGMRTQTVDAVLAGCPMLDFSVEVSIGQTNPQTFSLLVDTGSTTMAVASTSGGTQSCSGVTSCYNPTSQPLTASNAFQAAYGDGSSWNGEAYSDTVSLLGSSGVPTVFAGITTSNNFFQKKNCQDLIHDPPSSTQGILGFAGPQAALSATDGSGVKSTAWWSAYQNSSGAANIFALRMCKNSGDLWLGGYDNATFSGAELHWVNMQRIDLVNPTKNASIHFDAGQGLFNVAVNSMGIVGGTMENQTFVGATNIIDSGSTLFTLPGIIKYNLEKDLSGAYLAQFYALFSRTPSQFFDNKECYEETDKTNEAAINALLPPLQIVLGGAANEQPLTIQLNAVGSYILAVTADDITLFCPAVQSQPPWNPPPPGTPEINILGWTFLNQLIVAHDLQNRKVGFAPRIGCEDGSKGAVLVSGGETKVFDAAITAGSVTNNGGQGGVPQQREVNGGARAMSSTWSGTFAMFASILFFLVQ